VFWKPVGTGVQLFDTMLHIRTGVARRPSAPSTENSCNFTMMISLPHKNVFDPGCASGIQNVPHCKKSSARLFLFMVDAADP